LSVLGRRPWCPGGSLPRQFTADNLTMIRISHKLGFKVATSAEPQIMLAKLVLKP
jgi:hypothetical protein